MHRRLSSILIAVLLLLSACTPGSPPDPDAALLPAAPTPADSGAVTLTFGAPDTERLTYEPLISAFNDSNPDVRVQFVGLDPSLSQPTASTTMLEQVVRAADTAIVPSSLVHTSAAAAYLQDLTPLIDADATFDRSDYYPQALVGADQRGGVYALPREVATHLLLYNKDMWQERGASEPTPGWSWKDVFAAAEQLAQQRGGDVTTYGMLNTDGSVDEALVGSFVAAGIDLSTPAGEPRLDSPAGVAALQQVVELVTSGALYRRDPSEQTIIFSRFQELIQDGRVGIWPAAMHGSLRTSFDIGILPAPQLPLDDADQVSSYIMSKGTQHRAAAWRWLAFISRQQAQTAFPNGVQQATTLPARASLAESSGYWTTLDEETGIPGAAALIRAAVTAPQPPPSQRVQPQLPALLDSALDSVVTKQVSAAQALADVQTTWAGQPSQPASTATTSQPIAVATPQPNALPEGVVSITFGIPETQAKIARTLAHTFHEQNPSIVIDVKIFDSYGKPLHFADVAADSDCFSWSTPLPVAQTAVVLDLQPLIDADASFDFSDYPPALIAPFRHEGGVYGLPDKVDLLTLHYNKTLFDAAGLAYPSARWTLDDVLDAAQRLTNLQDPTPRYGFVSGGYQTYEITFFLEKFQAAPLESTGENVALTFTEPNVVAATRFYLDLLKNYSPQTQISKYSYGRSEEETEQFIEKGQVGMWLESGVQRTFTGERPTQDFVQAIAPPPLSSVVTSGDISMSGLFIAATTQQRAACWTWLNYLSRDIAYLQGTESFPARTSLAESEAFRSQAMSGATDVYAAYQPGLGRAVAQANGATLSSYDAVVDGYWFYQAIERALQGADLERELSAAQAKTEAYLACYNTSKQWLDCAQKADPDYQGYGLWLDALQ